MQRSERIPPSFLPNKLGINSKKRDSRVYRLSSGACPCGITGLCDIILLKYFQKNEYES